MKIHTAIFVICIALPTLSLAQSDADATGADRQRLGDERIRQEIELRAREEQRRLEEAEQQRLRAQEEARANQEALAPDPQPAPSRSGSDSDVSLMLEQLRTLGELKDSGYVTGEEFRKIKQRILDDQT